MKRLIFSNLLLAFFMLSSAFSMGQVVDSMMDIYRDNYPQEKIHLHFDKSYYNPGETIWFKAYLMSGTARSGISKNLYAELVNDKGVVIQRTASPVVAASAASSFTIPTAYNAQLVQVRAYTTWMLNFDTTFLFQKNIRVLAPSNAAGNQQANSSSITFFPEGGDLVNGIQSIVAFKANDRYGMPVKVSGYVKDNAGKKIIDFTSQHNGMGSFPFKPVPGETYSAVWRDSTKKEFTSALPTPKPTGVVLNMKRTTTGYAFHISRSPEASEFTQLHLIAHMHQQQVYKARVNLQAKTEVESNIPVDELPAGILQVTVFNSAWQPLAERIVFVNNSNYIFDTYFRSLLKDVKRRGKNVIEIEIPDTLPSNPSIAVTDAAANVPDQYEDNIYSDLLLTRDLKGFIYNPGYYFSSFADSVSKHLDLVMLTHGWRRFKWEDLIAKKTPQVKYLPENYITLKGSLIGMDPSKLNAKDLNLFIELKDSSKQFLSATLTNGKFELPNLFFYDTAKVFYQLNNSKTNTGDLVLKVENGLWKGYSTVQPPDANQISPRPDASIVQANRDITNKTVTVEFARNLKAKTLQEVVVTADRRTNVQKMDERYTSGLFRGGDGTSFDLTTDIAAQGSGTIFNYLQGRVAGLIINMAGGVPTLNWRGATPQVFLNEMPTDVQNIANIPMSDIAYVKVLRPPFIGAVGGGAGGAIAVYTRKGGETQPQSFRGLNRIVVSGFTPPKEFYSPNYGESNPMHDLEDLRTTLYWLPFIFLDKEKRKVALTFYNNDISKKLRVVIEGVNEAGQLTRVEELIQ